MVVMGNAGRGLAGQTCVPGLQQTLGTCIAIFCVQPFRSGIRQDRAAVRTESQARLSDTPATGNTIPWAKLLDCLARQGDDSENRGMLTATMFNNINDIFRARFQKVTWRTTVLASNGFDKQPNKRQNRLALRAALSILQTQGVQTHELDRAFAERSQSGIGLSRTSDSLQLVQPLFYFECALNTHGLAIASDHGNKDPDARGMVARDAFVRAIDYIKNALMRWSA